MVWPIHVPSSPAPTNTTADSKPIDKVLNRIARGTFYQVANTAGLADLLTALAAAGEAAPSSSAPVYADQLDTGVQKRNAGSGWIPMSPARGKSRNQTTSASGVIVITHGLGVTPTAILCTAFGFGGTDSFTFRTEASSSTTANIVVYRNGTIAASYAFAAAYGFDWVAFA